MSNVKRMRRPPTVGDFERMNLPEEFWRVKIQGVQESSQDLVRRYLVHYDTMAERGAGMLLFGPPGVGKSAIAALVAKEARSRGYTAFFTSVWELREAVRAKILFEEGRSLLDRCREVDLLVLDGLCQEDKSDVVFGGRALEELLAGRGRRKKVSIVTTRMSRSALQTHYKPLLDSVQGCMVLVPVDGVDLRQAQREELSKVVFGAE